MKQKLIQFLGRARGRFRTADKLTAMLAAVIVCVSLFTVVPAVASGPDVDSNIGGTELSISRFSEIMSNAFNSTMSQVLPNKAAANMYMTKIDKYDGGSSGVSMSTIGNVLGYPGGNDAAQDSGNVWTKGVDAASRVMTLESVAGFYALDQSNTVSALSTSNMTAYIIFGSALNSMGVDEFRDAQSAADGIRMITGYAAYVFFILAYSAADIMNKVVELMQDFNIFRMFYEGGSNFIRTLVPNSKFLDNIDSALGYMKSMRFLFLGLSLVFLVWITMVWKSKAMNNAATMQDRWRKFFMRIVIVAIGIPIIGMTYTECLDLIAAAADNPTYNITSYVFQEFMDFESWAKGSETSFKVGGSNADMKKFTVVYDSNSQTFSIGKDGGNYTIAEPMNVSEFVYSVNEGIIGQTYTGRAEDATYVDSLYGTSGIGSGTTMSYSDLLKDDNSSDAVRSVAYAACRNLLLNYARSTTMSADTLNDFFLADLTNLANKALVTKAEAGDANKAAAVNATAIEQLFGEDAANQRIWSYVQFEGEDPSSTDWIYPKDTSPRELILAETSGAQIKCTLKGIAMISGVDSNSAVSVQADGHSSVSLGLTTLNPSWRGVSGNTYVSPNRIKFTSQVKSSGAAGAVTERSYVYSVTYDLEKGGMSPLALYNYMHTKFENGQITVYDPDSTTNAGVGMMHYSVTTPYSGIPEIVQLLFIICMLFSVGIIGWVFGISLLMNTVVQTIKAIPVIFKILMGSLQGFVEGLLIMLSIAAELAVTVLLYAWAIDIIDFLIKIIQKVVEVILGAFKNVNGVGSMIDPESYAIMSGIISMLVILWGTFNLIKWRRAITLSIKSILTHVLNQVFGTSAAMPTGADSGMLKAGAGLAAGAMVAGALAEDGTLDDVVNDLTDSDLGSSLSEKIAEGDYEGAMQDIQDYANGNYTGSADRGRSETSDAQKALAEADDKIGGAFAASQQSLTDEQDEGWHDKWDDQIAAGEEKLNNAIESGDQDAIEEARDELAETLSAASADKAAMQAENKEMADQLGVSDYGDYLRAQKDGAGNPAIEGAEIPHTAQKDGKDAELDPDAQMAYNAARDGDAQTLRSAADIYDENGLDANQAAAVNDAVLDGATEEQVAEMIDDYASENFGDDHDAVVAKMNEAAGRGNTATYGDSNPTNGKEARTMSVQGMHGEEGEQQYGITDNNTGDRSLVGVGEDGKGHEIADTYLPESGGTELSAEDQAAYDAVASGDRNAIAAAAAGYSSVGTKDWQTDILKQMQADGASAAEISAAANNFAQDNFGDDYAQVVKSMNEAAGRDGTLQLAGIGSDGQVRASNLSMDIGSDGSVSYGVQDLGDGSKNGKTTKVKVNDEGGMSTYTGGGESVVTSDFGSGGVSGATYGELRTGMQTVANNSGGMIQVGAGKGSAGQMTVSEATAAMAGSMAMDATGGVADVKVGDVKNQSAVQSHVDAVEGVLSQGPTMGQAGLAAGLTYAATSYASGGNITTQAPASFVPQTAMQFSQAMPVQQAVSYTPQQNQAVIQAAQSGNVQQLQAMGSTYSAIGTTQEQTAYLRNMAASGASSTEIAAAANNFAQMNFGDDYAGVIKQLNAANNRSGGSLSVSGIGSDGQMRTVDVNMDMDSGGNVSYKVKGAGGSSKSQTVEVEESGGQVTYKGKGGETIVTQDFGSGTATGPTYGEIRESIRASNQNGALVDSSGSGGSAGHITVSEAAAAVAAQTVVETTGSATAASQVHVGNVTSTQAMADHVTQIQQLLYGGAGETGDGGESGESGGMSGTAQNLIYAQNAYNQLQSFLHSGPEVDPNAGQVEENDGTSGAIWGSENRG